MDERREKISIWVMETIACNRYTALSISPGSTDRRFANHRFANNTLDDLRSVADHRSFEPHD